MGKCLHWIYTGIDIFFYMIFWYFSILLLACISKRVPLLLAKEDSLEQDTLKHSRLTRDHLSCFAKFLNERWWKHNELFQLNSYSIYKEYVDGFWDLDISYSIRNQSDGLNEISSISPLRNSRVWYLDGYNLSNEAIRFFAAKLNQFYELISKHKSGLQTKFFIAHYKQIFNGRTK